MQNSIGKINALVIGCLNSLISYHRASRKHDGCRPRPKLHRLGVQTVHARAAQLLRHPTAFDAVGCRRRRGPCALARPSRQTRCASRSAIPVSSPSWKASDRPTSAHTPDDRQASVYRLRPRFNQTVVPFVHEAGLHRNCDHDSSVELEQILKDQLTPAISARLHKQPAF